MEKTEMMIGPDETCLNDMRSAAGGPKMAMSRQRAQLPVEAMKDWSGRQRGANSIPLRKKEGGPQAKGRKGRMPCIPDEELWDIPPEERNGDELRYDTSSLVARGDLLAMNCSRIGFISRGFMLGTVGHLIADYGIGKTTLALQQAVRVAAGADGLLPRGVLYLTAEDPIWLIAHRVQAINRAFKLEATEMADADQNLKVWSLIGQWPNLSVGSFRGVWWDEASPLTDAIFRIAETYRRYPLQLLIFDSLTGFIRGSVSSTDEMMSLMLVSKMLCRELGCSCLFLHHTDPNLKRYQQSLPENRVWTNRSGLRVLANHTTYQECMLPMSQAEAESLGEANRMGNITKSIAEAGERSMYVRWGVRKQSYGAPFSDEWLKRHEGGVLLPVRLGECAKKD